MDAARRRRGAIHSPGYQYLLEKLREARELSGLTQVEVAARLRRPQSWVSKSELGERRLDPIDLLEFAELYGRPVMFFLPPKNARTRRR
jgi:transcriptional regulator with XRE-family HTH domain